MGDLRPTPPRRRNVLHLIADDLGKNLNCYGCKAISTPNIDRLAANGVKFTHAYTSTASCSASRSVMYTGLHTHENGQYGLAGERHHFTTLNAVETTPLLFNALGYQTGIIGKVHVGPDQVYPWEIREESWSRNVAWVADRTEAFFKRANETERPFHLTVGFIDPHRDMTRSGFGNEEDCDGRINIPEYKTEEVEIPQFLSDLPETRVELVQYYRSISRMDAGVGMILAALERQGLAEDTLVVFVSDNGPPFMNSKTTLFDAGVRLPMIVRAPNTPGGIVNPNMISYIDILPTFLDWAGTKPETLPKLKPSPPSRLGHSFLRILSEPRELPASEWQDRVHGSHSFHEIQNYWPTRFLRTRRFKYHRNIAWRLDFPFATDIYGSLTWEGIRNTKPPVMVGPRPLKNYLFRPPEELFDLETDPDEVRNLAGDEKAGGKLPASKEHEGLLKELRREVEEWQLKTRDPWLYRDGVSVVLNEHHINNGMKIPDRWETDAEEPGNQGVRHWEAY